MNFDEIIALLKRKNKDPSLQAAIVQLKNEAIDSEDEQTANRLWCCEKIFLILKTYNNAYCHLKTAAMSSDELDESGYNSPKSKEYECAWNALERCDIEIGFLEENYCLAEDGIEDFHIYYPPFLRKAPMGS